MLVIEAWRAMIKIQDGDDHIQDGGLSVTYWAPLVLSLSSSLLRSPTGHGVVDRKMRENVNFLPFYFFLFGDQLKLIFFFIYLSKTSSNMTSPVASGSEILLALG